jgi:hypothetical protein
MRPIRSILTAAVATLVVSGLLVAGALGSSPKPTTMAGMTMSTKLTAESLRVALDNLFAEHAVLAMNTTNAGVSGSKSFPAAAKALDNNSVALSKAIASVYGTKAGAAGSRPTTQACAPASAAASAAFTATPPARTSIGAWITAPWGSCGIVTSSSTSPTQTRSGRIA